MVQQEQISTEPDPALVGSVEPASNDLSIGPPASRFSPGPAGHIASLHGRIVLRSMPKVLFLYPTLLAAIGCGVAMHYEPGYERRIALIFLVVFFLNMIVFSFDFPRNASLTLFFAIVAIVVGAVLINQHVTFLPRLHKWYSELQPHANDEFYWIIAAGLAVIFIAVLLIGIRFDWWEIDSSEVVHHHGWLHGTETYKTEQIRMSSEVADVFELLLLGSGRMVICLPNEQPVVLENVIRFRRRQKELEPLLNRTNVEVVGQRN